MKLQLAPNSRRARVLAGHPWVFAGELAAVPSPTYKGLSLPLLDARGRSLGSGIVNPDSQIVWRRFSRGDAVWGADYLRAALTAAIARRAAEPFRRLVWSEADNLPGLVVDQFDQYLVVQSFTAAVDAQLDVILSLLHGLLQPLDIMVRNDAPSRRLEKLPSSVFTRSGMPIPPFVGELSGLHYAFDLQSAHKTGFYLDQRVEHERVGRIASGRAVLDVCCNQGAFALQCAKHGASSVLGIDVSADAVAMASANAARNNLAVTFAVANAFDWFTAHRDRKFDLVVLDPPSFARNKAALDGALRGYKELNLRAIHALRPGGVLATYCCSQHVSRSMFRDVVAEAAGDAGRELEIVERCGQPADHPVCLHFPESDYLQGLVLRCR
jgi:23S rRNA (cytosine1962-C5)-methyltransferase